MNAAKLENSKRLQRVLRVLKRNSKPQSTRQLIDKSGHLAISSIASELRCNGINVKCKCANGAYWYWIGE